MAKTNKVEKTKLAGRAQVFVTTGIDGKMVYLLPDKVFALVEELGDDLKLNVNGTPMSINEVVQEIKDVRESFAELTKEIQDMDAELQKLRPVKNG